MGLFDIFRRRDIQFWAALATILALFVALLQWLFPEPFAKKEPNPMTPAATQVAAVSQATAPEPTNSMSQSVPQYVIVPSEKLYFPWTKWLTNFFQELPGETWPFVSGGLGIAFLAISLALGYVEWRRVVNYEDLSAGAIIAGVLAVPAIYYGFWVPIKLWNWGWWGALAGIFTAYFFALPIYVLFVKRIYGSIVGAVIGCSLGTAVILLYWIIPGPFIEIHLFVAGLLGMLVGASLGALIIPGDLFERN